MIVCYNDKFALTSHICTFNVVIRIIYKLYIYTWLNQCSSAFNTRSKSYDKSFKKNNCNIRLFYCLYILKSCLTNNNIKVSLAYSLKQFYYRIYYYKYIVYSYKVEVVLQYTILMVFLIN